MPFTNTVPEPPTAGSPQPVVSPMRTVGEPFVNTLDEPDAYGVL